MRERPVLFNGAMVRAILAGNKTQTRRVVKPWVPRLGIDAVPADVSYLPDFTCYRATCPYGQPGDRLWVRESTHRRPMLNLLTGEPLADEYDGGAYTADGADVLTPKGFDLAWWYSRKSCPSIHMPRFACRLLLEVTGVRVERLQDISEADAQGEGCAPAWLDADDNQTVHAHRQPTYRQGFARLWREINGPSSWDANPWVWVVEFCRADTDKKEM
ncbi:ASCH domain-containing protein [Achromobacter xylosoxidans]|uniref:hypothetical protein n=1 Tax=Alcaligenes xylosoxydans xylosoxydans TaxID=85698 RepID=UPI00292096E7|nr:hypothetical protein [Achromobacter xylosoxidans]BEG78426.1 hypothetical protein HBIAX_05528 [Achromobacter xylosoxidans]